MACRLYCTQRFLACSSLIGGINCFSSSPPLYSRQARPMCVPRDMVEGFVLCVTHLVSQAFTLRLVHTTVHRVLSRCRQDAASQVHHTYKLVHRFHFARRFVSDVRSSLRVVGRPAAAAAGGERQAHVIAPGIAVLLSRWHLRGETPLSRASTTQRAGLRSHIAWSSCSPVRWMDRVLASAVSSRWVPRSELEPR
jgi:hypothetical protein